jgi:hypothetical protein
MKKLIVATLLICISSSAALAQGTIAFQSLGSSTAGPTTVNAPIFDVDGVTLLSGTGFSVQLYAGIDDSSLAAVGSPINFLSGPFVGYFDGSDNLAISGFAQGATPRLQVRAWNNQGGTVTTYEGATIRGQSTAFTSPALGDDTAPYDPSTIPVPQGLTSFSLVLVPEPSVIALGILGAAGVILRRRKA